MTPALFSNTDGALFTGMADAGVIVYVIGQRYVIGGVSINDITDAFGTHLPISFGSNIAPSSTTSFIILPESASAAVTISTSLGSVGVTLVGTRRQFVSISEDAGGTLHAVAVDVTADSLGYADMLVINNSGVDFGASSNIAWASGGSTNFSVLSGASVVVANPHTFAVDRTDYDSTILGLPSSWSSLGTFMANTVQIFDTTPANIASGRIDFPAAQDDDTSTIRMIGGPLIFLAARRSTGINATARALPMFLGLAPVAPTITTRDIFAPWLGEDA